MCSGRLDTRVAGLGDLLDGLDQDVLSALPTVQRNALSAALLLEGTGVVRGAGAGGRRRRTQCAALLAGSAPLVLAVDDVQWLDESRAPP